MSIKTAIQQSVSRDLAKGVVKTDWGNVPSKVSGSFDQYLQSSKSKSQDTATNTSNSGSYNESFNGDILAILLDFSLTDGNQVLNSFTITSDKGVKFQGAYLQSLRHELNGAQAVNKFTITIDFVPNTTNDASSFESNLLRVASLNAKRQGDKVQSQLGPCCKFRYGYCDYKGVSHWSTNPQGGFYYEGLIYDYDVTVNGNYLSYTLYGFSDILNSLNDEISIPNQGKVKPSKVVRYIYDKYLKGTYTEKPDIDEDDMEVEIGAMSNQSIWSILNYLSQLSVNPTDAKIIEENQNKEESEQTLVQGWYTYWLDDSADHKKFYYKRLTNEGSQSLGKTTYTYVYAGGSNTLDHKVLNYSSEYSGTLYLALAASGYSEFNKKVKDLENSSVDNTNEDDLNSGSSSGIVGFIAKAVNYFKSAVEIADTNVWSEEFNKTNSQYAAATMMKKMFSLVPFRANLTVLGVLPGFKLGQTYIQLTVLMNNTTYVPATGKYMVLSQVNELSSSGFTTQYKLLKNADYNLTKATQVQNAKGNNNTITTTDQTI